ncbi:MAG: plasmid pRiA4b ORF-3 family protein [Crocinitomicaceae bacterium]|nr:plasmid pRiA4b ORF-3 family protein [Crocinitomicaceae bacterium]
MAGLKFRVLLDSKDKNEVFRDILISDSDNFESLYRAIVDAYQFSNDQMASFYMSNDNWDKGHEISLFDMSFGEDQDSIQPGVMSTSIIRNFIQDGDQKIILVHDFMRMWIFLIELIGFEEATPDRPKTILTVGNAPAESSKPADDENLQFETESDEEEQDEFGFDEFDDSYDQYDF